MKSGGHCQENIDFLKRRRFSYDIDSSYSNGVRFGHIVQHLNSRDRKTNGHAWFPEHWSRLDIKKAGEHVSSLKRNRRLLNNMRYTGRYQGVSVGIIARGGRIQTVFPCFDVNKHAIKKAHTVKKSDE